MLQIDNRKMISAADIVVTPPANATPTMPILFGPSMQSPTLHILEEVDVFYDRVRAMLKSGDYGRDKNVLATIAIIECIDFGFDTRGRILGACRQLGFKDGHPVNVLNHGTGEDPELYRWRRSVEGRYILND